jgi:hypothetical protein
MRCIPSLIPLSSMPAYRICQPQIQLVNTLGRTYRISSVLIPTVRTAFENNILYMIKQVSLLRILRYKYHSPIIRINRRPKCGMTATYLHQNRSIRPQKTLARHWASLRSPRSASVSLRVQLAWPLLMTRLAPYIRKQGRNDTEPDGPVHDVEVSLPPMSSTAGSQIRIPPALMPREEEALHYFKIFFADVHPYVPVIVRLHFYQQWQSNRGSISPLLLEAIFACAGRMSDDPAQGAQWLALANSRIRFNLDFQSSTDCEYRARRMFLRYASAEHLAGAAVVAESSRVCPQTRILLQIVDDLQDNRVNGKRPGSPRALQHPC